eukprot:g3774.t1
MGNKHGTRFNRSTSRDRAKGGESDRRRSIAVGELPAQRRDSGKAHRLSKTESLSDPKYIKDREEWMRNNNPYAADLESDRLYVRGVRKVEVDDLDSLFSTDKSLYVDSSASPGTLQKRQYTTDADLGEDIVDELSLQPKNGAENANEGSTEKILEWDETLHSKNSRLFRKTDEIYAFCTNDPCIFQKDWGQCEAKPGDWVIVGKHLNSKDGSQSLSNGVDRATLRNVYSITNDEFKASYVAVNGRPNMYIKRKPVRARRMSHKFVLKRAAEDQISVGDVGDYVVQSTSRQYIVSLMPSFRR